MERVLIRVIGGGQPEARGVHERDRLLIGVDDLERVAGWELKPQGLCRDDVCVPVRDRDALGPEGWIDLTALGTAVGQPIAVEPAAALAVIGRPAAERAVALASLEAPDVRLPTLDGSQVSVRDYHGRKRLVVAFASWCGCRYDLPAWQQLQENWADRNFSVIAVAVDESPEVVRPWAEEAKATFPVLVDVDHEFVDAYGIRNVPTVVWVDEKDRIVRPNAAEFGDDKFLDFHGQPSGPHRAALERWVVDGEMPYGSDAEVRARQLLPDDNQQQARAEYRLAVELLRNGQPELAEPHFVRAGELAPHDFTIRRGSMPLRGQDPFGQPFFELYREWDAAGRPYYTEPSGS
jgi:peroxiredoxin